MEKIRVSCGYNNGIDLSVEGSQGGLSLGWKENLDINLKSFSHSYINVMIKEDNA